MHVKCAVCARRTGLQLLDLGLQRRGPRLAARLLVLHGSSGGGWVEGRGGRESERSAHLMQLRLFIFTCSLAPKASEWPPCLMGLSRFHCG